MSVIGTLTAVVSANTAPFEQGMKRSQAAMGGLQSAASAAGAGVAGMGLKLFGVASGAALAWKGVSVFTDRLEKLDNLGDTADNLGMTANSLRNLQYAAEQSGSSAEGMNSALTTMEKNTVDAAMGLGKAQSAFKTLGIDAAQLAQQTPDQMFRTLAQAISEVPNPAERAQLAMKIFGDEGANLTTLLSSGAAGVDAFASENERLNGVLGDVSAAQAASDSIKAMETAWGTLIDTLVIGVAPAIVAITGFLTQNKGLVLALGVVVGGLTAIYLVHKVATLVFAAAKMAAAGATAIFMAVTGNPAGLVALTAGVVVAGAATVAYTSKVEAATKKIEGKTKAVKTNTAALQGQAKAAMAAQEKLEKMMQGLRDDNEAAGLSKMEKELLKLKKAGANPKQLAEARGLITSTDAKEKATKEKADAAKKLKDDAEKIFEATRTPAEAFAKKQADLSRLLGAGAISQNTYNRALKEADLDRVRAEKSQFKPADNPAALSYGTEAITQFFRNQKNTEGDPLQQLLKAQHEEEINKLDGLTQAVRDSGVRGVMM